MQKWIRVYKATLDTNIFLRALIRKGNICDNDFLEDANLKRILWEYGVKIVDISEFYKNLQEEFHI